MSDRGGQGAAVWIGTGFMLSGLFTICVGTGVAPVDPASIAAPGWIIALCGAVLVLAGLVAFVEVVGDSFIDPLAVLFIFAFAVVAGWVAFGSGDGSLYGGVSLGYPSSDPDGREMSGRVAFGLGAFALLVVATGISVRWILELRSERARSDRVLDFQERQAFLEARRAGAGSEGEEA